MNIFFRELKANRKALIIWCLSMFLLVISGMGKYTAYSSSGLNSDVFNDMPFTMKAILGIGSFDVTKMVGYFAMLFLYLEIAAAIHAALLGTGIIAKEERDKTTEFLMVKPVSRYLIITSKLLAALFNIIMLNVVTLISCVVMVSAYNKGEDITGEIVMFMLSMFIVQLIFFSLGTAMAAILNKSKAAGSITIGILLCGYIISRITELTDKLNFLNVFSPFKYFSYSKIADGNGLNGIIVIIAILMIAIFFVSTYYFYSKRDLRI